MALQGRRFHSHIQPWASDSQESAILYPSADVGPLRKSNLKVKYPSTKKSSLLRVCPIHSGRAQEEPCLWVVEPASRLDVTSERGHKWAEPINYGAFDALGIIRPRARGALLNLCKVRSRSVISRWYDQ
jgi:hypothetical protein